MEQSINYNFKIWFLLELVFGLKWRFDCPIQFLLLIHCNNSWILNYGNIYSAFFLFSIHCALAPVKWPLVLCPLISVNSLCSSSKRLRFIFKFSSNSFEFRYFLGFLYAEYEIVCPRIFIKTVSRNVRSLITNWIPSLGYWYWRVCLVNQT